MKNYSLRTSLYFILPALVIILAINIFPIIYAVWISFQNWSLAYVRPPQYTGFYNYEDALFFDDRFINAVFVSLKFVFLAVLIEFTLGFSLAFLFNQKLKALNFLRVVSLTPIMVMPVVSGLIWFYMFNENFGVLTYLVTLLGFDKPGWLTDPDIALFSIVLADVWQWTPFVMLIFFAALQSLPEYVYEAAKMDGLNKIQIFFRITLPLLKPAIWIVLILRIIDSFKMLELILMMTKGGPGGYTEVLPWYLYTTGFITLDIGYGASMAVMMLILVTILSQFFVKKIEGKN